MSEGGHNNRTLWIAFAANLGIAVSKPTIINLALGQGG